MLEAIYNKWKSKTITGEQPVEKPDMLGFINSIAVLELLHYHISINSKIAIHCDVDLDGLGSGYIVKRFISNISSIGQTTIINVGKEHGIKQRHANYFNNTDLGLLIIVDSSSNDVDIIKQFKCDVIVIDHHEVDHSELIGLTNDKQHRFVILNNTLDNPYTNNLNIWLPRVNSDSKVIFNDYIGNSQMSCGLVVYELLRIYQEAYKTGDILENAMLYQWVGVTLFTDAIPLLNERNQWYIENTVHSRYVEPTLQIMLSKLNKYAVTLDKSFINYTLAPTFNRAIRANANQEALEIVMDKPYNICNLEKYREIQDWSISRGIENAEICNTYCKVDLTCTGISKNYTGVIAGRVCDDNNKNTIAYTVENGIASGSFRGRSQEANYRQKFNEFTDVTAQGHHGAFGFSAPVDKINEILESLTQAESNISNKYYLTAGNIPIDLRGEYHIDNIDEFRKSGGLMMLGIGNSKVASDEQIVITIPATEAKLMEEHGKLYIYDIFGLSCKAFKTIDKPIINLYIEYSKSLDFYIK